MREKTLILLIAGFISAILVSPKIYVYVEEAQK